MKLVFSEMKSSREITFSCS